MNENFANLDFGTKVSTVALDEVIVIIDPTAMIGDFAQAYADELFRRNPMRAEAVACSKEELFSYFQALIAIRVESVNGTCRNWREVKQLYIPSWIEAVISKIGKVVDVERGILFKPTFSFSYEMDQLFATSTKLASFLADGVTMHKDAFPRDNEGDKDVMMMAIIEKFIMSISVTHPFASYVAAFLGLKLRQEEALKVLYRVRYDDFNFVKAMLLQEESIRA